MTSARTKPFWMSEWISPGGVPRGEPAAQVPGLRGLVLAGGEERDQVAAARRRRRRRGCRPDSRDAEVGAHRGGVLVVELGQLGLQARGDRDRAGALRPRRGRRSPAGPRRRPRRRWRRTAPAWRSAARGRARALGAVLGHRHACAPACPDCSASITSRSHASSAIAALSPPRACADDARRGGARPARGRRRSARSRSSRCRAAGRPSPRGGSTFVVVVRAHDVHDRVGLADVREELVAQALALAARPRRGRRCRGSRSCPGRSFEAPTVSATCSRRSSCDRHDRDVRLDRRERVVRRLRARAGERVEQRGLARVGHADDADLHARAPDRRAERRAGDDVRRASARRGTAARAAIATASRVQRRRRRPEARVLARAAQNDVEACALGKLSSRRRADERRQAVDPRAPAADDELQRGVQRRTCRPRRAAARGHSRAPRPVDRGADAAEREPQRRVLAERRRTRRSPARPAGVWPAVRAKRKAGEIQVPKAQTPNPTVCLSRSVRT